MAWRDDRGALAAAAPTPSATVSVPDGGDDEVNDAGATARKVVLDAGLRLVVVSADDARSGPRGGEGGRRTDSRVDTFEAWGPQERFDELRVALEATARTLRP